jgi:hypothetical protein
MDTHISQVKLVAGALKEVNLKLQLCLNGHISVTLRNADKNALLIEELYVSEPTKRIE